MRHLFVVVVVVIRFDTCLDRASQVPWVVEVSRQLSRPSLGLLDAIVLSLIFLSRHVNVRRRILYPAQNAEVADSEVEGSDTFLVRGARQVARLNLVEAGQGGRTPEKARR